MIEERLRKFITVAILDGNGLIDQVKIFFLLEILLQ